ncbi:hypothetical protein HYC85_026771 [Camellia sinensis]|uniref:ABC transporter family G domain-containing protein n=1 Tax=Camellia sinensis TaxID=4442 RepID=A0A7J7G4H5_CAMSI|nr:hypothetical protein HYC85_026771 [Camellia sinensis]
MLHNSYRVPADMMHFCDQIAASSAGKNSTASGVSEQSFAEDLWQDTKFNVELKRDHIENNLLKSHDLSNRVTADVLHQYRYFLGRYKSLLLLFNLIFNYYSFLFCIIGEYQQANFKV